MMKLGKRQIGFIGKDATYLQAVLRFRIFAMLFYFDVYIAMLLQQIENNPTRYLRA